MSFSEIEIDAARGKYGLERFGDVIQSVSTAADGYIWVIEHDGDLAIDGDLDQEFIEDALDEDIAEHTLVIVNGDLRVSGRIDFCADQAYTHLVVAGNVIAGAVMISSPVGVAGNLTTEELHRESDSLVVLGKLTAAEQSQDF